MVAKAGSGNVLFVSVKGSDYNSTLHFSLSFEAVKPTSLKGERT